MEENTFRDKLIPLKPLQIKSGQKIPDIEDGSESRVSLDIHGSYLREAARDKIINKIK